LKFSLFGVALNWEEDNNSSRLGRLGSWWPLATVVTVSLARVLVRKKIEKITAKMAIYFDEILEMWLMKCILT
jgi:hypothetical protein